MSASKNENLLTFQILTALQVISAAFVLLNELAASPGSADFRFPMEHQSSWPRVVMFCGGAAVCALVIWIFHAKKHWICWMPSIQTTVGLAAILILIGAGLSHYLSRIGWCCESNMAFHFGFPFSFLLRIGQNDAAMLRYANASLFEVLFQLKFPTTWEFLPGTFILNFLFWTNIVFTFLNLAAFLIPRGKIRQEIEVEAQPESR